VEQLELQRKKKFNECLKKYGARYDDDDEQNAVKFQINYC
jgi:hypothetical protein